MSSQSSRVLSPADGGGPSSSPPAVPQGWLAQWEGRQQRWYYVQPVTKISQWDIPTEPFIASTSSTPHTVSSPGPYPSPLPPNATAADPEATEEFMAVRSGTWGTGGGYPAGQQLKSQNSSPRSQRTPVATDMVQTSRSSPQSMRDHQIAPDLDSRGSADIMDQSRIGSNPPSQPASLPGQIPSFPTSTASPIGQPPFIAQPPHPENPGHAGFPPEQMGNNAPPVNVGSQNQYYGDQMQGNNPQPFPNQPQQMEPQYANQPIPVPAGQFPPRVSPVSKPQENVITLLNQDPNAPPIFPISHREAQRKRQTERQESFGNYQATGGPQYPPRGQEQGYHPQQPGGFGSNQPYDSRMDQGRPGYQEFNQQPNPGPQPGMRRNPSYGAPYPPDGPPYQGGMPNPQENAHPQQQYYGGEGRGWGR